MKFTDFRRSFAGSEQQSTCEEVHLMAKKKRGVNKSQAIRDYLAKQPDAKLKTIIAAMKGRGITVSDSLANAVKYEKGRSGKKKVTKAPVSRGAKAASGALSVDDLLEAKSLVDCLGGIDRAQKALETLQKLR